MIIGESLRSDSEKALTDDSGFMLGQVLKRMGLKRDDFTIASIIWCKPPTKRFSDSHYSDQAIEHCAPHLASLIQERQPKVILALGQVAFTSLTGITGIAPEDFRGYVHRDKRDERWVIGAFDPHWLMQGNFPQAPSLIFDLEKALRIVKEGYSYESIECLENPQMGVWNDYVSVALDDLRTNPSIPLAFDIETPYSKGKPEDELEEDPSFTINCISFSYQGQRGVTVPWQTAYLSGIQSLLETQNDKLIWNRPYDLPRVLYNGMSVGGSIRDAMDGAWHFLYSGLKRGLGFATSILQHRIPMWKHSAYANPERYSVYDAVMLWRNYETCCRLLKESGAWESYLLMVEGTDDPLLSMSKAGVLIDSEAKAKLREELIQLKVQVQGEMETLVPREVRPLKIYKTLRALKDPQDPLIELIEGSKKVKKCSNCGIIAKKPHVTSKTIKGVRNEPRGLFDSLENR